MTRPQLIIAPGKEKALLRRHPWVFSGAVKRVVGDPHEGDVVDVVDAHGQWMAVGHYQNDSIICKVLSFDSPVVDDDFFRRRLRSAIAYRQRLGFMGSELTNVFRMVHAEGDGLPGLVCDWYNGVLVMQAHSVGMHRLFPLLQELFVELLAPLGLKSIFDKSSATCPKVSGLSDFSDSYIWGVEMSEHEICEHGNRMLINFYEGQKTGFFIDQRENRGLVQQLSAGHRVLNCFGYTGGFSLAALRGGAEWVETVDISKKAIDLCNRNVALNFGPDAPHRGTVADVLKYLAGSSEFGVQSSEFGARSSEFGVQSSEFNGKNSPLPTPHSPLPTPHSPLPTPHSPLPTSHSPLAPDFIILDPPAFAKSHRHLQQGLKGYRTINQRALEVLPKGGLLMTFSCSQAVSKEDFQTMVFTAAMNARRTVRIVRQLPHAADHPVSICHPEGEYLKGLLLQVE